MTLGTLGDPHVPVMALDTEPINVCRVCGELGGWYYSSGLYKEPPDYGYKYWQGQYGQWCKAHVEAEVEKRKLNFAAWMVQQTWYQNRRML